MRAVALLHSFGYEEARRTFTEVGKSDPGCAMAQWGIAYAAGPNYNLPWHLYDPAGNKTYQIHANAYDTKGLLGASTNVTVSAK